MRRSTFQEETLLWKVGGSLILNSSTVKIACFLNGERRVDVYGAFNATNGLSISSFDRAFLFTIHGGASVYMADSNVGNCGYKLYVWGN